MRESYADVLENYIIAEEFFREVREIRHPERSRDKNEGKFKQCALYKAASNRNVNDKDKIDLDKSLAKELYKSNESFDDEEDVLESHMIAEEGFKVPSSVKNVNSSSFINEVSRVIYEEYELGKIPTSNRKEAYKQTENAYYDNLNTTIPGVNGGSSQLTKYKGVPIVFAFDDDNNPVGAFIPTKDGKRKFVKFSF